MEIVIFHFSGTSTSIMLLYLLTHTQQPTHQTLILPKSQQNSPTAKSAGGGG